MSHNAFLIAYLLLTAILTLVNIAYIYAGLFLFWLSNYRQRFNAPSTPVSPAAAAIAARRRGLTLEAVESLPIVIFSASTSSTMAASCAICLSEFEEGNTLRFLPACHHQFHTPCIDPWLHLHRTCPVCRSLVSEPAPAPAKVREPDSSAGDHVIVVVDSSFSGDQR